MTSKEEARESLRTIINNLPIKIDETSKAVIADAMYDFINHIIEAVGDEYHIIRK